MDCPRDAHGFCKFWSLGASSCRGDDCTREDRSPKALERVRQLRIRDFSPTKEEE
jgi:hypothetical protein